MLTWPVKASARSAPRKRNHVAEKVGRALRHPISEESLCELARWHLVRKMSSTRDGRESRSSTGNGGVESTLAYGHVDLSAFGVARDERKENNGDLNVLSGSADTR